MDEDLRDLERRARTGGAADRERWLSAAVRQGRGADLLDELLVAWRGDRSAATAAVVDDLSSRLGTPALGDERGDLQARWLVMAKRRSSVELPALLATLGSGTHAQVTERLDALEPWPDDPRIAGALAAIVDAMPFRAKTSQKAWTRIFKRLVRERDPRTIPALTKTLEKPSGIAGDGMAQFVRERIEKTLAALRETAASSPPPEPEPEPEQSTSDRPEDALLAAVLDDPTNDAHRIAYGEALAARGDPRGAFIGVQAAKRRGEALSKASLALEKKLLAAHREGWLDGLAPVLVLSSVSFELGFVAAAHAKESLPARRIAEVSELRAWRTIERLAAPPDLLRPLLERGLLPSLRDLRTFSWARAGRPAPPLLSRLATAFERPEDLASVAALPALEHLELSAIGAAEGMTASDLAPLATSPAGARLEAVKVTGLSRHVDGWRGVLERCPRLASFEIDAGGGAFSLTFRRSPSGRLSALTVDRVRSKSEGGVIAQALGLLGETALETLEVALPAGTFREQGVRDAALRFTGCDVTIRIA